MTSPAGRPPVTSRRELEQVALELFATSGFDATTVDDISDAAGIGRRTFFRYFPSKNDAVWGEFDENLSSLAAHLDAIPQDVPLLEALRDAIERFNVLDPTQVPWHRSRMTLILTVPALQAHSTLRYAAWRAVIARFVARRQGVDPTDLLPQLIAHLCLGAALTAYEQWLAHPGSDLAALLSHALTALDGSWTR